MIFQQHDQSRLLRFLEILPYICDSWISYYLAINLFFYNEDYHRFSIIVIIASLLYLVFVWEKCPVNELVCTKGIIGHEICSFGDIRSCGTIWEKFLNSYGWTP